MSQLTALLVKQMEFKEAKAFAYRYYAEVQAAYSHLILAVQIYINILHTFEALGPCRYQNKYFYKSSFAFRHEYSLGLSCVRQLLIAFECADCTRQTSP